MTSDRVRRRIGVLSSGRQDWGVLRSTVLALPRHGFDVRLLLGGMACSERFGRIDGLIESDGIPIAARLAWMADAPTAAHHEAGQALALIGDALVREGVESLVLVGDRYETLAAATAATILRIPLVHLHGGEETEGAFDNSIRHAITKLAHVHLASHPAYAARLVAMGEDPASVHVVGAPGLDNLRRSDLATRAELEETLGSRLASPLVAVTVHPSTLATDATADVEAVCAAIRELTGVTFVLTLPNSDPGNELVRSRLLAVVDGARVVAAEALGERRYWGLLRIADAMLGNSSSGVIEAPAVHLPVVNVGDRQKGRLRSPGIIDVAPEAREVVAALRRALEPTFRERIRREPAPFGDGHAADAIAQILEQWHPTSPPVKRFARVA